MSDSTPGSPVWEDVERTDAAMVPLLLALVILGTMDPTVNSLMVCCYSKDTKTRNRRRRKREGRRRGGEVRGEG